MLTHVHRVTHCDAMLTNVNNMLIMLLNVTQCDPMLRNVNYVTHHDSMLTNANKMLIMLLSVTQCYYITFPYDHDTSC